jgi:phospholipid/cholesterol/gamma-HCH transport system permease protein
MSIAETKDLFVGIAKAFVFALAIGTLAVNEGLSTKLGATGVGKATQRAVIASFLAILVSGYMITRLFYR